MTAAGFVFVTASVLYPEATTAYPRCNVPDCVQLQGKVTRKQVQDACDKQGGIATGTNAKSGGYGCFSEEGKGGWVECDDNGECVGGPARRAPRGARQLDSILKGGTPPDRTLTR
jgi:hypothetical protein